ncbi:hypothetical protein SAMN05421812_114118 [Asanoa hainanensis]|uniref:DUF4878 domain-containing protein n=1 Tax=Asanoa hainanensis TaxID=560556 RepID=A0A239P632_9ACTN|nr:hypothetical protein [Asanoa hainanensis]SNT62567.1 hypothetical protein SAMN05421812_114118 [Asanoa hainanensis]
MVSDEARRAGILTAVLLVAGLVVGGFFLFRGHRDPEQGARLAADSFLTRLAAGNIGGAYDQLCNETRERVERDDFVAGIGGRPAVSSYRIDGVAATGPSDATVTAELLDPVGASTPYELRVTDDRGTWRVCGNPLDSTG